MIRKQHKIDLLKDGPFRVPPHDDFEHRRQKLSVARRLVLGARRHRVRDVAENLGNEMKSLKRSIRQPIVLFGLISFLVTF
jgi:hypothetical protein